MRRISRFARTAIGLIAVLAIAAPAAATHGGVHPTFRNEQTYFHCTGSTKLQNVNYLTNGPATWDTTAPGQSYTEGAGCGHLDASLYGTAPETPYDVIFKGTFTGNLRNLTIELHNLLLSQARQGSTYDIGLRISIDGEQLFGDGTTQGRQITLTPTPSSTGLTEKMTFSVAGIGCAREILDAEGNVVDVVTDGVATETGDGSLERELVVTVDQWYLDRAAGWVWDASEIPAGIVFNPETTATTTVEPDDPANCG